MLRRSCRSVCVDDHSGRVEQLSSQVLEETQRSRCHRHAAPAPALAVEDGEDECDARAFAGKPSHDLRAPPRLAEGALNEVGVPAALPVFGREAQVHGQGLEVLDEARNRSRVGALPLGAEALQAPSSLSDGLVAGRCFDAVEDGPPVGLEGVLVGLGDFGKCVPEAVDDTALTQRPWEDLLDRRDQPRSAVRDDEERVREASALEVLQKPPPRLGRLRGAGSEANEVGLAVGVDAPGAQHRLGRGVLVALGSWSRPRTGSRGGARRDLVP